MTVEDIRSTVINNALDFFRRSTEELEHSPKYSLINFCAAVELFVKARLMKEHWTLIVTKPQDADWERFVSGDFHSVSLKDAQERLKAIARDPLTRDEYACFSALASHRNQLVHFRHRDQNDNEKFRAKIAGEQLRAWYYLQLLLRRRWQKHFPSIGAEIWIMEQSMRQRQDYLSAKFAAIQPELQEQRTKGVQFSACRFCGFEAFFVTDLLAELTRFGCRVCDSYGPQLEIDCPECGERMFCLYDGYAECDRCKKEILPKEIVEFFVDSDLVYANATGDSDKPAVANCADCESKGTVVPFHGQYLCVSCFKLTENCWQCQWCNEWINEKTGPTPIEGCFRCSSAREDWMDRQ
ncbi:MAG: hypothetical protein IT365_04260 [Candidatus Hydrogenedentes bacterium]|nr:hypothetical protein [Candidatus Hydrogenedentota bacterium]